MVDDQHEYPPAGSICLYGAHYQVLPVGYPLVSHSRQLGGSFVLLQVMVLEVFLILFNSCFSRPFCVAVSLVIIFDTFQDISVDFGISVSYGPGNSRFLSLILYFSILFKTFFLFGMLPFGLHKLYSILCCFVSSSLPPCNNIMLFLYLNFMW